MAPPKKRLDDEETISVSVRWPVTLKDQAAQLGKDDDRSFNSVAVRALREWVEREQAKRKGGR